MAREANRTGTCSSFHRRPEGRVGPVASNVVRIPKLLLVFALVAGLALISETADGHVTVNDRGSLGQVHVWGADEGATLELRDSSDTVVTTGVADESGAFIFGIAPESTDDVPTGTGYTVHQGADVSNAVDVFDASSPNTPPQS